MSIWVRGNQLDTGKPRGAQWGRLESGAKDFHLGCFVQRILQHENVVGNAMTTLYRASNGYAGIWSCWSPDRGSAIAYRDNPGYGGEQIIETIPAGNTLDIRGGDGRQRLADALADYLDADAGDLASEWRAAGYGWCYEVWESSRIVRDVLVEHFDWVRHTEETFPEGAETWVRLS